MITDEINERAYKAACLRPNGEISGSITRGDMQRALTAVLPLIRDEVGVRQFSLGERVTKIKGSSWTGRVVGFYRTTLTPEGYAVESETERGSVQIYPAAAIRALKGGEA